MPLLVSIHLTHHSRTIVRSPLVRRQAGYDLDLDGFEADHITLGATILFRNPYIGLRLNDGGLRSGPPCGAGDRRVRFERGAGHHGR
jgi:hypothetical protein